MRRRLERLPRPDRAADRLLRRARPAAPLRRHAPARRGPRPHPRDARDAAPGGDAVIIRKTPEEIEKIAAAGRDRRAHAAPARAPGPRRASRPPSSTRPPSATSARRAACPTFKGYRGFPASICASPNSMVVHGIPGPYALERGDLISLDVGVTLDGWVADAARTLRGRPGRRARAEAARRHRARRCSPASSSASSATASATSRTRSRPRAEGARPRDRAHARRPRRRAQDARGSADPELRRARHRARACSRAWCSRSSR